MKTKKKRKRGKHQGLKNIVSIVILICCPWILIILMAVSLAGDYDKIFEKERMKNNGY